jgi:hypothetical protein
MLNAKPIDYLKGCGCILLIGLFCLLVWALFIGAGVGTVVLFKASLEPLNFTVVNEDCNSNDWVKIEETEVTYKLTDGRIIAIKENTEELYAGLPLNANLYLNGTPYNISSISNCQAYKITYNGKLIDEIMMNGSLFRKTEP